MITSTSRIEEDDYIKIQKNQVYELGDVAMCTFSPNLSPIITKDEDQEKMENMSEQFKEMDRELVETRNINKQLTTEVKSLEEESALLSRKMLELLEEKIKMKKKFKFFKIAKEDEIDVIKVKLASLKRLLKDKDKQLKELWNIIQMLNDAKLNLKRQADQWEQSEMQLKKEIVDLRVRLANEDDKPDTIFTSPQTFDWKAKMETELSSWGVQQSTSRRSTGLLHDQKLKRCWIHGENKVIRKSFYEKKTKIRFSQGPEHTLRKRYIAPAVMTEGTISGVFENVKQISPGAINNVNVQEACSLRAVCKSNVWKENDMINETVWGCALWPTECIINSSTPRQSQTQKTEW